MKRETFTACLHTNKLKKNRFFEMTKKMTNI